MNTPALLEVNKLWFAYADSVPVLREISFTLAQGEFVALIGQNGSGKTTLAKQLNGLLRPTRGQVLLEGNDIRDRPVGILARTVGYVFQNPDQQIFSPTVIDEIAFGPRNLAFSPEQVQKQVENALERFALRAYANDSPATLGFGLRRRVTLAAVYAMETPLLILDEPTAGLDYQSTVALMQLLTSLHQQGRTIVIITHDMRIVADYVPQCMVLHQGELIAYDTTRAIFQQAEQLKRLNLELPQVTRLAQHLEPYGMPKGVLTVDEFCVAYTSLVGSKASEK